MRQSKIEEIIDESFNRLIDTMIKFPENPYHINFEEIFFKGKADLIHKLEKIINQKEKQIDLMAKYLAINGVERDICNEKRINENCKNVTVDNITVHRCKECIKQYFERQLNSSEQN